MQSRNTAGTACFRIPQISRDRALVLRHSSNEGLPKIVCSYAEPQHSGNRVFPHPSNKP